MTTILIKELSYFEYILDMCTDKVLDLEHAKLKKIILSASDNTIDIDNEKYSKHTNETDSNKLRNIIATENNYTVANILKTLIIIKEHKLKQTNYLTEHTTQQIFYCYRIIENLNNTRLRKKKASLFTYIVLTAILYIALRNLCSLG